jgi:hypothetical protein
MLPSVDPISPRRGGKHVLGVSLTSVCSQGDVPFIIPGKPSPSLAQTPSVSLPEITQPSLPHAPSNYQDGGPHSTIRVNNGTTLPRTISRRSRARDDVVLVSHLESCVSRSVTLLSPTGLASGSLDQSNSNRFKRSCSRPLGQAPLTSWYSFER